MALTWPSPKDPNEVKDYGLDWSALLDDDTITTSAWSVDDSGLTIGTTSNTTTATTVWVSSGSAGVTYNLLNRIVTAGGRTYDQTVKLKVRTK
ncbi:hypothetical protein [Sinorhizobium meliloti]|uniref:phage fiber-tail adaptor protein n=1 Tax=Rhizobium meliloti TaxID=382 RepID=UPI000FDAEE1D|nr:hypothetical protein [Sinorhizobium meliloti]RVG88683.1 hypothetical protein CN219_03695 [Sinorhizobium meliloti]RVI39035.1 hypothetical protein CN197_02540 [Sinorhizobium meliloti]RVI46670.1 hypothetical protein CN196_09390 [Sinorhizobium meliloti]RVJ25672.1 hypothetical protein CN177_13430 [Sinorhizobium meliloti]RVK02249.1 hypothetical protein CN170_08700 [Sinorhizobium meliloti]